MLQLYDEARVQRWIYSTFCQNTREYLDKGHLTEIMRRWLHLLQSTRPCFIEADAAKALHNVL